MQVLPALLGTVVGASLALVADHARYRRDRGERRRDERRDAYAKFLSAVHTTSEGIRVIAVADSAQLTDRSSAARNAFRAADLHGLREQVVLLAPRSVAQIADDMFRTLRAMRDLVGEGGDPDAPNYQRLLKRYRGGLA